MEAHRVLAAQMLQKHTIFAHLPHEVLCDCLERKGIWRTFRRGEALQVQADYCRALGLLLTGRACVRKGNAVISQLQPGELFGAVTLFQRKEAYATQITAEKACSTVFLPKDAVCTLMQAYPSLAQDYIAYLSQRVEFLTQRIAAFTCGGSQEKLLRYLREHALPGEENALFIPLGNYSVLAGKLDMGRASLYRALGEMERQGTLQRVDGGIVLYDTAPETTIL